MRGLAKPAHKVNNAEPNSVLKTTPPIRVALRPIAAK